MSDKQDDAAEVISMEDHLDAAHLASEAGQLLLAIRKEIGTSLSPEEARHLGDTKSHEFLAAAIGERHPHDGLLSEEGKDGAERLCRQRV
jgi:3'(2'), 5'-bisphosphate nucleotidase